jgi:predicted nucleic acid-binding protein
MVLVDTSVWADHLRQNVPLLGDLLEAGEVMTHPFVIGELACGNLANPGEILALLSSLPAVEIATHSEVMHMVDANTLHGRGLGWIDVHLLASARLSRVSIWTRDRRLQAASKALGIGEKP